MTLECTGVVGKLRGNAGGPTGRIRVTLPTEKMKTKLVSMVLLVAAVWPFILRADEMELVVGTYQKGSNITEPRPAESKYLRTTLGGFHLIQGMAGFKLFIEVIQHPEQRVYTRVMIENPKAADERFVYEHYLDPDTPSITITHGPAIGLKIYKDYTLDVFLFSDAARTQEIDHLTQKIRSYVDTTGKKLKLFKGIKAKSADGMKQLTAPPSAEPPH